MTYDPNQYQRDAMRSASNSGITPPTELEWPNFNAKELEQICGFTLGLSGESGEVADYLKKVLFHGHPFDKAKLTKELGDVQWYIAAVASLFDISLGEIMLTNIEKLKARYPDKFNTTDSIKRIDESDIQETAKTEHKGSFTDA